MSKITIGPCCVKQKNVQLDNEYWNLSDFQISRLKEIMEDPDFEFFAMPNVGDMSTPRPSGNIIVPYYRKDGTLVSENIGIFRVISTVTA